MKRNFIYAPISSDCFLWQVIKIEFLVTIYLDYWDFVPGLLLIRATYYHHWSWIKVPTLLSKFYFFHRELNNFDIRSTPWCQKIDHIFKQLCTIFLAWKLFLEFLNTSFTMHCRTFKSWILSISGSSSTSGTRMERVVASVCSIALMIIGNILDLISVSSLIVLTHSIPFNFILRHICRLIVSISSFLLHSLNHIMSTLLSFTFCVLSSTTNLPLGKLCSAFF